jgi:coproporphyrinogen III oxidase
VSESMPDAPDLSAVRRYFMRLQDSICAALEREDATAHFRGAPAPEGLGPVARPRVLEDGSVFERAAVHFTHSAGRTLPDAATRARSELAGSSFEAVSVSLIVHPRNPYVPTCHANFRFFLTDATRTVPVWWFGGGMDLTPCYGFEEDAVHWHRAAREACRALDPGAYPRFKRWCDEYFYLPHRGECRGIGGIFFDDLREPGFSTCFAFVRSAGDHVLPAYLPIVQRRRDLPFGPRERDFQLVRRGRYVEFNLLHDRGTRFGLEAGGPVESILASLPPEVRWHYEWRPVPGSDEERLIREFLPPRDWLGQDP